MGEPNNASPDAGLTEMIRAQMPFADTLKLSAISATAERVVVQGEWAPEWCTTAGAMHGGFLMALADSAGAVCAVFNLPAGSITTTIESKTNFLRAVTGGVVIATAVPVHVGRTVIVVQTDITRADGKLVTRTTQTQAVVSLTR